MLIECLRNFAIATVRNGPHRILFRVDIACLGFLEGSLLLVVVDDLRVRAVLVTLELIAAKGLSSLDVFLIFFIIFLLLDHTVLMSFSNLLYGSGWSGLSYYFLSFG
jgi:hypothetical protein